ncbi:MAG: hypothetical protein E6575_19280 [Bradyrhizobium sp.]|nr:hypothetical protein [Bradyrhizobium sp.]
MGDEALFRIRNEDDAWDIFQAALEKKIEVAPQQLKINWEGWPRIRIYLPDVPEDGSISSSMMGAILQLQKSIYRTHALLSTGSDNLRTLSQIERERFEIRVKVDKGSSDLSINLSDIISKYGNDIIAKMTGTELLIMVLGLALTYAGKLVVSEFLKAKTDQRRLASDDDKTRELLANYRAQLEHDSKRFELLTKALDQRPILKQIEDSAAEARDEILKAVAEEHGGEIQGIAVPHEVATEISSVSRAQSSEARLAGQYRVAKVDTTVTDGFRVTLEDIKTGQLVTASLFDAVISSEHRRILQDAEWNKKPLFVEMSARMLRGRVVDAKIVSVGVQQPQRAK